MVDIGVGHFQDIGQTHDGHGKKRARDLNQRDEEICQRHNMRMRNRIGRKYATPITQKVRHKRQTMKGMTKPLKQWLYHHRDYPYPNRKEKLILSMESTMTMVQVSNWFANARRRLKNTVNDPRMTWEQRIHKYNRHVTGNAERLSISSGDTSGDDFIDGEGFDGFDSDDSSTANYDENVSTSCSKRCDFGHNEDNSIHPGLRSPQTQETRIPSPSCHPTSTNIIPPPSYLKQTLPTHKYKHSIMQRYLNDSYNHAQKMQLDASRTEAGCNVGISQPHIPETSCNPSSYPERMKQSGQEWPRQSGQEWARQPGQEWSRHPGQEWFKFRVEGSVGSHEYEVISGSSEAAMSLGAGSQRQRHCSEEFSLSSFSDDWTSLLKDTKNMEFKDGDDEETYWQEIVAAVALTNMARSRQQGK